MHVREGNVLSAKLDLWLAGVDEWYEYIKERDVPEDGFLNPSNCSLRYLDTEDKGGAIHLKD